MPTERLRRLAAAGHGPRARLALLSWAAALLAAPALAAGARGLIVVPRPATPTGLSYFKLEAARGSAVRAGAIELRNQTQARMRVALSGVDGETLGTLGSGYAPPGSRPRGATRWLRLERRMVSLPPGGSVSVPIAAVVPPHARPGDYLSGVSVESLDQRPRTTARRGVSIASLSRYVIGVEVSVPGPRRPLIRFTGARIQRQPAGLTFLLLARNAGNVVLQGVHGYARITRAGHTVASQAIESGTFVTHTRIAYPVNAFGENAAAGTRYRITAWMQYPGGIARLDTGVTFGRRDAAIQSRYRHAPPAAKGGTPWWEIAGVALAVLYGLFTTILLLRRRRRGEAGQPAAG